MTAGNGRQKGGKAPGRPDAGIRIALAGNPNSGKTTLFNAITGAHHKVGNYPGVTVEKREGVRVRGARQYHFIDLPGIYSLTAYSIDEVVARDFILDENPDIIVDVLDSTNLERNLYLCLQFQELGIPVVGALNMTDEAEAKGISIDEKTLSQTLGIPMVKTVGPKGAGMDDLLDCIDSIVSRPSGGPVEAPGGRHSITYGDEIEAKLQDLGNLILTDTGFSARFPVRWLAVKLLEKDANAFERLKCHPRAAEIGACAKEAGLWIDRHFGKDSEIIITEQRYGYIRGAVKESIKLIKHSDFSVTEAVDKVIMNRFLALPIFILVLWTMFQITFFLGEYPMTWLEILFGLMGDFFTFVIPEGLLRSLIVDGIIGGVGGVLSFVPLIVILFFLLSILEDVGYMSRAAFATDKFLHAFGLHGQSIVPLMLGFGCSVPAIMASRTLKSPRDRILTVLITPLMSCGAKLPVHVLLAAAFFPEHAANMVILIYSIGVALSLICALVLKRTILKGDPTPFVMELPPYRAPTLRGVLWHVWEKTWMYMKKAGTVILASSIIIWAITTFPSYKMNGSEKTELAAAFSRENPEADSAGLETYLANAEAQNALAYSFAGRLGHFLEPLFRPLGFDWKIAVASVTGFAAKEVIVSTLGILYRVGAGEEENEGLRDALNRDSHMRPLAAFVLMLFTLIIPPCFAALAAMKAEIGARWVGFELVFLFCLGWALGFIVYQAGSLAGY
ncbi:MAG: ferrous iron transport protein B [Treponema sp.]|jgi:ferrous iron transport protein B|nr:ferrous iron transport protein B [Treponema sp.]